MTVFIVTEAGGEEAAGEADSAGRCSARVTVRAVGGSTLEETDVEALLAPPGGEILDAAPLGPAGGAAVGTTTAAEHLGHLIVRPAYWSPT